METHRQKASLADITSTRRAELGLTQAELAKKLKYRHSSFIAMVEKGTSLVPIDKALDFAEALEMDPDWFLERVLRQYYPRIAERLYDGKKVDKKSS